MGCGNCGSGSNGKPGGCKGNGGCSTGGCNRLNVYDWLNALPLSDSSKPFPVIEVSFNKGSRKDFFRNNTHHIFEKGEWIAVEGVGGYDVGQVNLTGELVKLQMKKYGVSNDQSLLKRVLHPATEDELNQLSKQKEREAEVLVRSRAMARNLNLEMKLAEVEIQADGKKATFFYTADSRVDFRELIRVYASEFKVRVEMRQIGARQESGKVGGIGSCGRELCCSTWLTDFKSVNTTAARYQNLAINQTKLSGQCGRLKCCLNYELDTYMDALSVFPTHADTIETVQGVASLQKRDIFKNLMWYSFSNSSKQYPLSIVRVKEILALNKQGVKVDELQPVELEVKEAVKIDVGFVNDVGQISLKSLEKNSNKRRNKNNKPTGQQGNNPRPQQPNARPGNKPQGNNQPRPNQPQAKPQGANQPRPNQNANQQGRPQGGNQPRPNQQGGKPQGANQPRPNPNQQNRPQGNQQRPPRQPRPDNRNTPPAPEKPTE